MDKYTDTYVFVYIYIYIEREREREIFIYIYIQLYNMYTRTDIHSTTCVIVSTYLYMYVSKHILHAHTFNQRFTPHTHKSIETSTSHDATLSTCSPRQPS